MSRVTRLTGYALALCLLPTAILRAQLIEEVFAPNPGDLYSSYVELGGIGGDMPETGQTYLFTPLWQTESELFFADLRGLYNDQGATEGNWGLGYRKMITPDTIFGRLRLLRSAQYPIRQHLPAGHAGDGNSPCTKRSSLECLHSRSRSG